MSLDPRSMIALGGLMAAMMALVLVFMRRHYPPYIRGLGHWALAPMLWLVSTALFSGRGVLPDIVTMVGANLLLTVGTVVFYMGTRRFLGHPTYWDRWSAAIALATLVFAVSTYIEPNYAFRVAIFTAMNASLYLAQLLFLLRHGGRNFPVRMVEVVLLAHLVVLVLRFGSVLAGHAGSNLMEPSFFQSLYVGAYTLTVLLLPIGAILMATDRLRTELEYLATHDPLTQVLNRRALLQRCDEEMARSKRHGHGPAIMMIDLDHFKTLNDTQGHQHGDAVLVHFAERVRSVLRKPDQFGRYGGEEFLVLLPGTDAHAALQVARRIHEALAVGHLLDCRVSIGVTHWNGPSDTLDAMLSRADAALYQAKRQGRNQTCVQ